MASLSQITKRKRALKARKAGRKRKLKESRRSTLSYDELFAKCGAPGSPAPRS